MEMEMEEEMEGRSMNKNSEGKMVKETGDPEDKEDEFEIIAVEMTDKEGTSGQGGHCQEKGRGRGRGSLYTTATREVPPRPLKNQGHRQYCL